MAMSLDPVVQCDLGSLMAVEHQKLTAHLPAFLQPVAGEDLVRIGSAGDGGYVVSRAMLDGARFLLSFGLGDDWAFEAAICDSLPVTATVCHAYDRTTSPEMLTAANRDELVASYEALFDGNRAVHFRQHVGMENNASTVSLANALSRIPQGVPVLLKMDIEGSEYALLDEIANDPGPVHGLIFEIHCLDRLGDHAVALLLRLMTRFDMVHVHANNCGGVGANGLPLLLEVSMIRRVAPYLTRSVHPVRYPIDNLDAPNCDWLPDIDLCFAAMKPRQRVSKPVRFLHALTRNKAR